MTTPNTYTNWPNLRSLATVPTSIELLGTTSSNEPVRFLASLLAAQITAGEDGASVRMAYRRTLTVTRPVQPTSTRDVNTGVVTLGTPWEWDGPPTGTAPYIWASIANVPADRTENATFDTAFRLNGVDGMNGTDGAHGDDGANGTGFQIIYRDAVTTTETAPAAPTGGTRGNNGLLDTLPTDWSLTPPTDEGYRWASIVGLPSLVTAAPVYSTPFLYSGPAGTQAFMIFQWTASSTSGPTQLGMLRTTITADGTDLVRGLDWGTPSWYPSSEIPAMDDTTPYLWASTAFRNGNTGRTTFGVPFRVTGTDGTDGTPGARGARGDDGRSFVVLYYGNDDPDSGPTDPTTWRREADGTPDFNNPPSGWSTTVPSNRHIWLIVATVPGDITSPISFRSSFRITGLDGAPGTAAARGDSQLFIFTRSATTPAAPTGGTRRTDGTPDTLPTNWTIAVPLGDDPLYASVMTVPGERATALSYTAPFLLSGPAGARGAQGLHGYGTVPIFYQLAEGSTPGRPTGGSFSGGVLDPPVNWSLTEPAEQTGMDVWFAFAVIAPDGGITYSIPHRPGQDGSDGAMGRDGRDGESSFVIFQRSAVMPQTPAADSGTFTSATGTYLPPTGWSLDVPAGSDVLWGTFVRIDPTGVDGGALMSIVYSGVFTLGEALNIREIRNELASLTGNDRLPASAISGLVAGHDPRVDALERATVDLNAIEGRIVQGHDTTDTIDIAITEDEDPNALPPARWGKNIVTHGRAVSLWIRVPQSADLRNGSTSTIDLRDYVIQVTNPDESEILREFPVSSFDQFAVDTSSIYDYLRQGSPGSSVPTYTWVNTAHVRIRKYEPTDRHSVYSGITVVPDVGSVPDTNRIEGELRRNGDDVLQVFNRHGEWQSVISTEPVDQLDTIPLDHAIQWSELGTIGFGGRGIGVASAGSIAAIAHSASGSVLGRQRGLITLPDDAGSVWGWSSNWFGIHHIDVSALLDGEALTPIDHPSHLWLEVLLTPSTGGDPHPVLRGPMTAPVYSEAVELRADGMVGLRPGDAITIRVMDAFGIVRWRFVSGEMRVRLVQETVGANAGIGWDQQYLRDYPAGVSRRYIPASQGGVTQRALVLYSRGQEAGPTDLDSMQAHTSSLFQGQLGPPTQAATTGIFGPILNPATQASTTGIFTRLLQGQLQANTNGLFTGQNYEVSLKSTLEVRAGTYGTALSRFDSTNDWHGASGNKWAINIQRLSAPASDQPDYAVSLRVEDSGANVGAGIIDITINTNAVELTWGSSDTVRNFLTAFFDFSNIPEGGIPDNTPINSPAVGTFTSTYIALSGGADPTVTADVNYRATLKDELPDHIGGTATSAFSRTNDWIGASGNNWQIVIERGTISDVSGYSANLSANRQSGVLVGGRVNILVDNRIVTPTYGDSTLVKSLLASLFDFSDTPDDGVPDNVLFNAPAPHSNTPTIITLTGGADRAPAEQGQGTGANWNATFRYDWLDDGQPLGADPEAFSTAHDWIGASGNGWQVVTERVTATGPERISIGLGVQTTGANQGAGRITIEVDNRIPYLTWGHSQTVRDALTSVFNITGTAATVPDDQIIQTPAQNNNTAVISTFSGGAEGVSSAANAPEVLATLRPDLPDSILGGQTYAENRDWVGASGNLWRVFLSRSANIPESEGVRVSLAQNITPGSPTQGAGNIAIACSTELATPTFGDLPASSRTLLDQLFEFSTFPVLSIPDDMVWRVPAVVGPSVELQLVGGADAPDAPDVEVGADPDPPENSITGNQASITVQAADFITSGRALKLTLRETLDPDVRLEDGGDVPSDAAAGSRGNNWSIRLEMYDDNIIDTDLIQEHDQYIFVIQIPLSSFTSRNNDIVTAFDFFGGVLEDVIDDIFTIEHIGDTSNGAYAWDLPGFPPLAQRQSGDSITYRASGGLLGGPVEYSAGGWVNPGWANWHEQDPNPDSEHTLWIAQTTATLGADFRWTYHPWTIFPSGLGGHHVQYAASPNGPWSAEERTTGYWRHRDADGGWGPAIQLHDPSSGEWVFIGHYTIANASDDSDFAATSTWTDGSGRTVHNHGRVINLSHSFSLNDMSDIGFEFEFWAGDNDRVRSSETTSLLMRYWAQFPVLEDWTTPQPGASTFPLYEGFIPDPDFTVAWMLRRQGAGSNNDEIPVGFAGRPGSDSGYWFGGRRPSNLERWYSSEYMRGGMLNLMSDSTTDRRFVDRFAFFNRVNNKNQAVRIWAKVK